MEKSLYLTVLVVFAVLGSTVSASNNKFLLRELIRELEEAQVDTPASVPPKTTPSDVEVDLPNTNDLTGLGGNDEEEQTHPGGNDEEGAEGQEGTEEHAGEEGVDGHEGEEGTEGQEGQGGAEGHKGEEGTEGQKGEEGTEGQEGQEGTEGHDGEEGTEGQEGEEGTEGQEGQEGAEGHKGEEGTEGQEGEEGAEGQEGETADVHEGEEGETTGQTGDVATGEGEGQDENNNGGEGGEGADEEHPKMDEGVNEDEIPIEPVKGEGPSALEKSAVRTVRLIDNLSRMLAMRATSLAKIDKVLTEGPEVNYPNTEKLVQKQQQLEIMSARILEMKKVLGHFFDQIYDRFHSFMTDVEEKEDHLPPVSNPKESVPLIKPDSTTEKQTELLKRLLSALKRHKRKTYM